MSTRRVARKLPPMSKRPRGPNGHLLCWWCKTEVTPPRRSWCSDECVHEWQIRSNVGYMRSCVFGRDSGICKSCGIDTVKRQQDARLELRAAFEAAGNPRVWSPKGYEIAKRLGEQWKQDGWPATVERDWWEAEHLVPVCRGGGECGLEGIATLCVPCHKRSTAKLAAERAAERKNHEIKPAKPPGSSDPFVGGR
jgi:5-methylcytosine-specific restriction protein A